MHEQMHVAKHLFSKVWFPYDRSRNATQTIASDPDNWDDLDRLDRIEF